MRTVMISLHERIKRVLITGGSRGIGLAAARRLLDLDVDVYCCSRRPSTLEHPRFRHIPVDFADPEASCRAVAEYFDERDFAPDVLICAAGVIREALIPRQDDSMLDEQLAVNFLAHMRLIRWAVGRMLAQRFGRIVAVSSTAARFPAPGQAAYAAAKAGQEAFLNACAVEFASKGITCNSVVPGYIETDFSSTHLEGRSLRKVVPAGRAGRACEAADAILLFLGENSDYMTGSRIVVDGGLSLAVK